MSSLPDNRTFNPFITTALALVASLPLHADPVTATPADAFVDSIGVNSFSL